MTPEHLPKISLVTPNYNGARYLQETLDNIASQAYPNLQHIVIDGGSTDESLAILKRNADRFSYWVSEPDEGMYDAINKGFTQADGEIFCYLNGDDLYLPGVLHKVAAVFRNQPFELLTGDTDLIGVEGELLYRLRTPSMSIRQAEWLGRVPFNQQSCFWSPKAFAAVGGFDTSYRLAADSKFFYAVLQLPNAIWVHLPEQLGCFRLHDETLSSTQVEKHREETLRMEEEMGVAANTVEEKIRRLMIESLFKIKNINKYLRYTLMGKKADND
jgi:glycosyltransferase involved in cell wall biosynthesis